jgi:hypothetical protein
MRIGRGGAGVGLLAHRTEEADTLTLVTILTGFVGTPQKRHAHAEQQEKTRDESNIAPEKAHGGR